MDISISQRQRYIEYQKQKEKQKLPKHIYKNTSGYSISKSVNGERIYFKNLPTLNEAVEYRDKLIANNWEPLPLTDEEIHERNVKEYYKGVIRSTNHRQYRVNNCHGDYLGNCSSIEEALQYRDLYYSYCFDDAPRPSSLDLTENNTYLDDGLKYPLPERLIPTCKSNYGKGSIKKKGEFSYHITYGGKQGGNKRYYCACRTYEQAWYVRRELQKCNWDHDKVDEILDSYPLFYTELMELYQYVNMNHHIKNTTGKIRWQITIPKKYLEDGKNLEIINNYTHLEDALYERDFLVAHDWDYDLLVETIDDRLNPYWDMDLPPYPQRKILNLGNRDYHEKELTEIAKLIYAGEIVNQMEAAEYLGVNDVNIRNWLKRFWNSNWQEFKRISLTGENPVNVLEKVKKIYTPDLSKPMPSNFNGWVHKAGSKLNPFMVRKGNVEYGCYPTEKMARRVVRKLQACNWDKSKLPAIKESVGFVPRPKRGNIYPNTNSRSWSVRHKEPGTRKMINYGSYKDYDLAVIVRDMLVLNDWNKEEYPSIRSLAEDVLNIRRLLENNMFHGEYDNNLLEYLCAIEDVYTDERKYIYSYGRNYIVQKSVNGCIERFGVYNTREDAVTARNLLIDNNWDREVLELVKELKL